MFDKNNKRSLRRWKTECKHNQRANKFANKRWWFYGLENTNTHIDRVNHFKSNSQILLETPRNCSCSQCSTKNSWVHKSELKRIRDEERNIIDNFFKVEYTDDDSELKQG